MSKPNYYFQKPLLYAILFMLFCVTNLVSAEVLTSTDSILQQAREKKAAGDLSGASILYQQILNRDSNHPIAGKELASVLMEAQIAEPEADMTDATHSILQQRKNNQAEDNFSKGL